MILHTRSSGGIDVQHRMTPKRGNSFSIIRLVRYHERNDSNLLLSTFSAILLYTRYCTFAVASIRYRFVWRLQTRSFSLGRENKNGAARDVEFHETFNFRFSVTRLNPFFIHSAFQTDAKLIVRTKLRVPVETYTMLN